MPRCASIKRGSSNAVLGEQWTAVLTLSSVATSPGVTVQAEADPPTSAAAPANSSSAKSLSQRHLPRGAKTLVSSCSAARKASACQLRNVHLKNERRIDLPERVSESHTRLTSSGPSPPD